MIEHYYKLNIFLGYLSNIPTKNPSIHQNKKFVSILFNWLYVQNNYEYVYCLFDHYSEQVIDTVNSIFDQYYFPDILENSLRFYFLYNKHYLDFLKKYTKNYKFNQNRLKNRLIKEGYDLFIESYRAECNNNRLELFYRKLKNILDNPNNEYPENYFRSQRFTTRIKYDDLNFAFTHMNM